jgi:uncharacterized protein (DUF488 family)
MGKLYTIGHSNRSLKEFVTLLEKYQIDTLVDVRSIPKSRHVPWFNQNNLTKVLKKKDISYILLTSLGGRRLAHKNSINNAWRNKSFQGYADYMLTRDFFNGLKDLISIVSQNRRTAIMCAEAVPWRCHRSLIADAIIARGKNVWEILSLTSLRKHKLTPFAKINRHSKPLQILYQGE